MGTYELLTWLDETFKVPELLPVITMEDMERAGKDLIKLTADYVYLSDLLSWGKALTREAKRTLPKSDYEDMVDKRDSVERKLDSIKQAYTGISRAVTIKQENNQELRMTGSRVA